MSLELHSNSYKHQDKYKVSKNVFNIKKEDNNNNYKSNEKRQSTFGKIMKKFKKFPSKILTAKQIRENKDFKETRHFQEGNNFIHISKNLKNKKSGEEITQEVRIKGGTSNNQYDYDNFFESEQLPKENKNWNFQNKNTKYKSKKKCRYGLKCRNKKKCKFNHDNDNNQQLQNYHQNNYHQNNNQQLQNYHQNNNQQLQNYHQNNDKFFFDDNFAATFFS
jgi:hypothetical protein